MNKEFRFFESQLPDGAPLVYLADIEQESDQEGSVYGNTPPSVFAAPPVHRVQA